MPIVNLNTNGDVLAYTVWDKTNLTDAAWVCAPLTPATASSR